ncbi:hypothetical protein PAPYR_9455 [Paratrimastix pyriformis]|uniref:Uncharacterized protein n=1 Tax=Paratrimastix pyriformis TaxID=342808 RepID=A0ABQ8U8B3_9EUKA|nr:hypothetical protein PAPYR_9455 [Paratrimastix pyriformis]
MSRLVPTGERILREKLSKQASQARRIQHKARAAQKPGLSSATDPNPVHTLGSLSDGGGAEPGEAGTYALPEDHRGALTAEQKALLLAKREFRNPRAGRRAYSTVRPGAQPGLRAGPATRPPAHSKVAGQLPTRGPRALAAKAALARFQDQQQQQQHEMEEEEKAAGPAGTGAGAEAEAEVAGEAAGEEEEVLVLAAPLPGPKAAHPGPRS